MISSAHWLRTGSMLFEEVSQHIVAVFGEQGFGVELYAFHGVLFMAHAHDFAVCRPGSNVEAFGQAGMFDGEAVVAGAVYGIGQAGEYAAVGVVYGRYFAVHQLLRAHDAATKGFADGLVAEAYAQNGNLPGKAAQGGHGNAGFFGRAGAGADHEVLGLEFGNFVQRDVVVAAHADFLAELGEILDDVVGEGVVVVDKQKHNLNILLIYNVICFTNCY